MCEVAQHEPKYIVSSLSGLRSNDSFFSDDKDFLALPPGPPPGLGFGKAHADLDEVPAGPPPGLGGAANFGYSCDNDGIGFKSAAVQQQRSSTNTLGLMTSDVEEAVVVHVVVTEMAEAVLADDPLDSMETGFDFGSKKKSNHQRQRNAERKRALAAQIPHVAADQGWSADMWNCAAMQSMQYAAAAQMAWACSQYPAVAAYPNASMFAASPSPPGTWSRTSSTTATTVPTSASPPPSPTSRSDLSPSPVLCETVAAEEAMADIAALCEDLPAEPVVKEGLSRGVDAASGAEVIEWLVKEQRLRSLDKQAVSPSFQVCLPGQEPAVFRIMITPAARSDGRGAGSFKQSKGRGRVSVKCVEPPAGAETMSVTFSLRIGEGPNGEPERGPFTHDFIDRSCFEQQDATWNFAGAVDSRRVFAVQLLLQGVKKSED